MRRIPAIYGGALVQRSLYALWAVFAILATGIVVGGYFYYRSYQRQHRIEVEHQLSSIAELKVAELASWRQERLADASFLSQNDACSASVRRYLDEPGDIVRNVGWLVSTAKRRK